MRLNVGSALGALLVLPVALTFAQPPARTLVAVWAHADDEGPVAPILARYAREGVNVHMIIATDGAQGVANTSLPRGPQVAQVRAEEARCAAVALGIHSPVLLGFPDGALGNTIDPTMLYRLTQRLHEELQRLQPDVLVTWGPDGGYGHPDHRIVSSIVTQLVRAGAPGLPQRLYYTSIPAEGIRAMYPNRGEPPLLIPQPSLFTVRVSFTDQDFEAARRSMACHKTQFSDQVIERVTKAMREVWNGAVLLSSLVPQPPSEDLFR